MPIILAQLLIYSGASITQSKIDLNNINWQELEKKYYSNDKTNDIGLGLVLNGGSIMRAINFNGKNAGDETANKRN